MNIIFPALLAVLVLSTSAQAQNCPRVDGVRAICRSPIVERKAEALVMRCCPECNRTAVADWVYSLQMNRGPYLSERKLAEDVLQQVRP